LDYRGIIVSKMIEYLHFKYMYRNTPQKDISEDFSERIEPELALEL
jgi:transcription elongation factor B subunit 1